MPKSNKIKMSSIFGGDRTLWIIVLLLSLFSIVVIYSSTASMAYKDMNGNTNFYLISQVRYVFLGLIFMFAIHWINYNRYLKYANLIFVVAVCLMIATFFAGTKINDANRWLKVPYTTLTFQPSDFLKIALTIYLAKQLASRQKIIDKIPILPSFSYRQWKLYPQKNSQIFWKTTMPIVVPIAICCAMVIISNLSTAAIIGTSCLIVLIIGRVRYREIFRIIALGVMVFIFMVLVLKMFNVGRVDTWTSRVENFFVLDSGQEQSKDDVDEKFQTQQAKIAVSSGWIIGKGAGKSTQRSNLPHPYSDYAYAFIVEEYGILGALGVLGCFLWIFYRTIVIFRKCDTAFPGILVLGLGLMITMQAIIHMVVSVDLGPVTGQTLPFISKGGSALLFTCSAMGIILGVSRVQNEHESARILVEKRNLVKEWEHVVIKPVKQNEELPRANRSAEINVTPKKDEYKDKEYQGIIWDDRHKNNS